MRLRKLAALLACVMLILSALISCDDPNTGDVGAKEPTQSGGEDSGEADKDADSESGSGDKYDSFESIFGDQEVELPVLPFE